MIIQYKLAILTLVLGFHQQGHAIIGGHEAVPHSRPYMVFLELHMSGGFLSLFLKLSTKAEFNNKVKPIALVDRDDGSLPKSCVISGWGSTENSTYMSVKLLEVNVTLTDNELCANVNMYCSESKRGPGLGDSGGPLVCEDGKAYGVISASASNPDGSTIHSYTKIPDYQEHHICVRDTD